MHDVVGDLTVTAKGKTVITFAQIIDPETLSFVIQNLKDRHSKANFTERNEGIKVKCDKCGNADLLSQSKFCNKCGFQLSSNQDSMEGSLYLDTEILPGQTTLNPEQY